MNILLSNQELIVQVKNSSVARMDIVSFKEHNDFNTSSKDLKEWGFLSFIDFQILFSLIVNLPACSPNDILECQYHSSID